LGFGFKIAVKKARKKAELRLENCNL